MKLSVLSAITLVVVALASSTEVAHGTAVVPQVEATPNLRVLKKGDKEDEDTPDPKDICKDLEKDEKKECEKRVKECEKRLGLDKKKGKKDEEDTEIDCSTIPDGGCDGCEDVINNSGVSASGVSGGNTGLIVGGVAGGVVAAALAVFACRRTKRNNDFDDLDTYQK